MRKSIFILILLLGLALLSSASLAQNNDEFAPEEGQARIYLENNYFDEFFLDFDGAGYKVSPNDETFFDLKPGTYDFFITIPSGGSIQDSITIGFDESWQFQLNEGRQLIKTQLYPDPSTIPTATPSPTPDLPDSPLAPELGKARVYLENNFFDEFFLDFDNDGYKLVPNEKASFDLEPGTYSYSFSVPSGGNSRADIIIRANEAWLFQLNEGRQLVTQLVYPEPATQPVSTVSTPTPEPERAEGDFTPPSGQALLFFENNFKDEFYIDLSGMRVRVLPDEAKELTDLEPGTYTYSFSIPSGGFDRNEFIIGPDEAWLFQLNEGRQLVKTQLYAPPQEESGPAPTSTPDVIQPLSPGQARIYLENNYFDEFFLDIDGNGVQVDPGEDAYIDLTKPGTFGYSFSIPSGGSSRADITIGRDESWLFQLNEGRQLIKTLVEEELDVANEIEASEATITLINNFDELLFIEVEGSIISVPAGNQEIVDVDSGTLGYSVSAPTGKVEGEFDLAVGDAAELIIDANGEVTQTP